MDGDSIATLGGMLTCAGDLERGLALTGRAKQLNPHHPGWYWWVDFCNAYRQGDYRGALGFALKMNLPGHWFMHAAMSAAYGQLGERAAASRALQDLLEMRPDFAATVRMNIEKWWDAEFVEHLMDGWRKAGLEIAATPAAAAAVSSDSGVVRADEGFWIAVLPFKFGGAEVSLTNLAEGLTEEIVTGLSRFSYLRVISRRSAADAQSAGKELGARYVMEGSLRQSGTKLRLGVQLVDAATGAHLWAESYERAFSPEAVFELQDDLVPRIVSTVADMNGVLPRSMSEAVRSRKPEELSPYEAVLRSFGYFERVSAEELGAARAGLESAVRKAPANADAWAMLALLSVQEHAQGFQLQADPLVSGSTAARNAVEAAPSSPLAHFGLAQALFFQKEFQGFRKAAERAIALNPMDGNSIAFLGELLTYAGDWERGMALAERAKQLNPNHPGWYWYADFYNAYRQGDDRGALGFAQKADLPGHWGMHAALAAACGQLGEREAAGKAVRDLLKLRPDFPTTARKDIEKWWEPAYVERLIDGWRKAGLEIGESAADAHAGVAIAVLPFSDMSAAKDQEYLCEGMAEEIMNALVRIDGIRVASRNSTFRARHDGGGLEAIAARCRSATSSRAACAPRAPVFASPPSSPRSRPATSSGRSDSTVRRPMSSPSRTRSRPASSKRSRRGSVPAQEAVQARAQATNLEAYRWYLKGRHLRHAKEDHGGAMRAFEEAVRLDPGHAPSWTGLAESTFIAAFSELSAREACARAGKALARAVALQGESADSLDAEAFVAMLERRWPAMEATWRKALELEPHHVLALGSFGVSLCFCGKPEEGLRFLERARESDPLASFPYMLTAWGMLHDGRPHEALQLRGGCAVVREGGLSGPASVRMANVALGNFEEGHRGRQHAVAVTDQAPLLPGVARMGVRDGGTDGRSPRDPRGGADAADPRRLRRRLRGLAARRARSDRRSVRRDRARRGGVPGPAVLHRNARLRSAPLRPALRGAVAEAGMTPRTGALRCDPPRRVRSMAALRLRRRRRAGVPDADLAQDGHHRAPAREGGLQEVGADECREEVEARVDEPAEGERGEDERPRDPPQPGLDACLRSHTMLLSGSRSGAPAFAGARFSSERLSR